MFSVLRPSQHYPGLHTSIPLNFYSWFKIFHDTYFWKKQTYWIWTSSKTRNDSKSFPINKRNINSTQYISNKSKCCILTFWPGQKCHSKVMHRKEVTHSNGSYERKSRGRKLADERGRAKKFPWYTHRLMHRKRVTCELHDSYFRLMTIKHAIPKIEWAIELLYNSVKTGSQWVGVEMSWRQEVVKKATTQQNGPSGPPIELEIRWVGDKMW